MAEERFDIYDEHLNPLGTASRSETHARGYWHRSFHCWLTRREENRRFVRFQLRQTGKDTYPGCYDITAAGHLTAGETVEDAAREIEEELGVAARFEELIPLGKARKEMVGEVNGVPFIDREISDVFALVCSLPLDALKLQAEEVAAVFEADVEQMIRLFEGELPELICEGVETTADGGLSKATRAVRAAEFVPRESSYYASIMKALRDCT
ncbi:NUDIX domain-containing protein [Paenibacillus glycanilyticus]|uniref:NUDIX hydrolase n=1 Tax=Paenibacillus glycanilyticus TaxID=126569 RepID=UPI00203EBE92|nr:NUDIX domain-containing protein [Paenibacillus glycanilyticus]MCM3630382.1 NUDIX domain-containing protein [Paenibacillus glycanilyticus]